MRVHASIDIILYSRLSRPWVRTLRREHGQRTSTAKQRKGRGGRGGRVRSATLAARNSARIESVWAFLGRRRPLCPCVRRPARPFSRDTCSLPRSPPSALLSHTGGVLVRLCSIWDPILPTSRAKRRLLSSGAHPLGDRHSPYPVWHLFALSQ